MAGLRYNGSKTLSGRPSRGVQSLGALDKSSGRLRRTATVWYRSWRACRGLNGVNLIESFLKNKPPPSQPGRLPINQQASSMTLQERIHLQFTTSLHTSQEAFVNLSELIEIAALKLSQSLVNDGKILVCGNGGSAALAQHFASQMLNRYERERPSLPAIALNTDTSTITSITNDYLYEEVFAKQIRALGHSNDSLLVFTCSGNSPSTLSAVTAAHDRDMTVIALSGWDGGALAPLLSDSDIEIRIPSESRPRVLEAHLIIVHCLCDLIDHQLFGE